MCMSRCPSTFVEKPVPSSAEGLAPLLTVGERVYFWALSLAPLTRRLSRRHPVLITVPSCCVQIGQGELSSSVLRQGCPGCLCPGTPVGARVSLSASTNKPPGNRTRTALTAHVVWGVSPASWGFRRSSKPCSSSAANLLSRGCRTGDRCLVSAFQLSRFHVAARLLISPVDSCHSLTLNVCLVTGKDCA